jgi:penicillin-binding protein 1A
MVTHGLASPAAARDAERAPLPVAPGPLQPIPVAPYFVDAVRRELSAVIGIDAVLRGGLRVRTTLDPRMQAAAEAAVEVGLRDVDRRARVWSDRDHVSPAIMGAHLAALAQERGHTAPPSGRVVRAIVTRAREQAYEVDAGTDRGLLAYDDLVGRYAASDAEARGLLRRGDVVPVSFQSGPREDDELRSVTLELGPQAALVALDPATGAIRSLVGGDDFATHPFNRVVQARRQPGSTFKTFVYAAAIEKGVLEPDAELENVERRYRNGRGGWWRPRNIDGAAIGGTVTAREALARSINGIAVEVLRLTGVEAVRDLARRVGIASPLGRDLTLALGSSDVTLLELTGAYGVFAAGGLRAEPRLVEAVLDPAGRNVWPEPLPAQRAVSPEVAEQVGSMLREVVTSGRAAAVPGVDVVGKTGTSDAARDSWFVGWAPGLAVGVWVGHDDARPLRDGGGGRVAAPIWQRFVASALGRPSAVAEEAAAPE